MYNKYPYVFSTESCHRQGINLKGTQERHIKFNVFRVRVLVSYKNTNHQQMHKESFIINRNTLLHVSTLLAHLQGEIFCYRYTKVALCS
jgi:hypothetical protein